MAHDEPGHEVVDENVAAQGDYFDDIYAYDPAMDEAAGSHLGAATGGVGDVAPMEGVFGAHDGTPESQIVVSQGAVLLSRGVAPADQGEVARGVAPDDRGEGSRRVDPAHGGVEPMVEDVAPAAQGSSDGESIGMVPRRLDFGVVAPVFANDDDDTMSTHSLVRHRPGKEHADDRSVRQHVHSLVCNVSSVPAIGTSAAPSVPVGVSTIPVIASTSQPAAPTVPMTLSSTPPMPGISQLLVCSFSEFH